MTKLNFSFDLRKCQFQIDALQNRLLEFYLRADRRFRHAFSINYTNDFLQFIRDKARLREPQHLSFMGQVRSGKSYSAITICIFHTACYGKEFTSEYICANAMEFLEKLKSMPEHKLKDSIFLIDEEKQAIFGVGSIAKKTKISDVQNIIAINNVSTIMINPVSWQNKDAFYGLRAFGRDFEYGINRFMLYNLQERGNTGLPLGNVYLPIFTKVLPKEQADKLEKEYLAKKQRWVNQEMRSDGDVLGEIKRNTAKVLIKDKKFLTLKTKRDRMTYISQKLGSEWTSTEITEIESITKLLREGLLN